MTSENSQVVAKCTTPDGQMSAKKKARTMVGDGKSPNKFFVTMGPYVGVEAPDGYGIEPKLIDGFTDDGVETFGPFSNYDDALEFYNGVELDVDFGVGQVFIEDRKVGTIREKFLKEKIAITYVEDEINDEAFMKDY